MSKDFSKAVGINAKERAAITGFIAANDLKSIPCGRYDVDGGIYVNVFVAETKADNDGVFEAHKEKTDVHYLIEGEETILTCRADACVEVAAYDAKDDYTLLRADKFEVNRLSESEYLVTTPQTAHKPGLSVNAPQKIKKAVFKISVSR